MNQTAETRQQPSFDEPLANGLTPSEIFDAVVEEFETGHTSHSSFIAEAEELVVWQHEVSLARTGSICRIAALDGHAHRLVHRQRLRRPAGLLRHDLEAGDGPASGLSVHDPEARPRPRRGACATGSTQPSPPLPPPHSLSLASVL